ncbi:MAG: carboxypeptidase regulatory-like domain-containing protein [Armatimonadota bacterium]|nr:carboxypeptidase regulatory-like domain-containing protein [Armatimonadota bacterium]
MRIPIASALLLILAVGAGLCWTTPVPVARTSQDSLDPRVASDDRGNAYVVWRERVGGTTFQIWYASNVNGNFANPVQISQGGSAHCYWPVIVVDGSVVHTAWTSDQTGSNFEIWYRKLHGSWGPIYNASNTAIKSLRPAIATKGSVGPIVTWDEALYADDNYDVLFSEWIGSGFSSAFNVSDTPGGPVYGSVNSSVAVAPNGDVTVIWAERITGDYHINARRRVCGLWFPRQEISTKATGPATPGIAVGPDNQVHIVYNAEGQNWYQKWNGSSWTAPVALPGGVPNLLRPKIAVDDYGFCHVVADNSSYGVGEIWYSTNVSGLWSPWVNISNTPGSNSLLADISYGGGIITVVWEENSDQAGGTGVYNVWYTQQIVRPPEPSGILSGRVVDQFGKGIAGVTVAAGPFETATSEGGNYSLVLPPGCYTVSATKLYYAGKTVSGVQVLANQITYLDLTVTASPPSAVSFFAVTPSDGVNRIIWTNPVSPNFIGTVIQFKETGFPTSPTDGTRLCERLALPGSSDSFEHVGLTNGVTYYYAAFAHDLDGHFAPPVYASASPHLISCLEAKLAPEGATVDLKRKIVSAVFPLLGYIYVQDENGASGMRVSYSGTDVSVGDVVSLTGKVTTRYVSSRPSERQLTLTTSISKPSSGHVVKPRAMTCRAVGGAVISGEYATVPGVMESDGRSGVGLNNMGLLVRIAGKVTAKLNDTFWLDDGSRVQDYLGRIGVMVRCPDANIPAAVGDFVCVTGIVEGSIPVGWETNRRFIRLRSWSDMQVVSK